MDSNRYESDLSIEVLNIDFGQWVAWISKVKVGSWKKSAGSAPAVVSNPTKSAIMLRPQTLTSDIFAAPWPK